MKMFNARNSNRYIETKLRESEPMQCSSFSYCCTLTVGPPASSVDGAEPAWGVGPGEVSGAT